MDDPFEVTRNWTEYGAWVEMPGCGICGLTLLKTAAGWHSQAGRENSLRPEHPLVSVITVTFNAEQTLEKTIRSVLDQSYRPLEHLIVDGGSTDGTLAIVRRYADRLGGWLSEPDRGIFDAMNKGIRQSRGALIGILNADDWYEPDAVARVVQAVRANPRADVIHGDMYFVSPDLTSRDLFKPCLRYRRLWRKMAVWHPACFIRRESYDRIGLYDPSWICADHHLLLRFFLEGASFVYVPAVLANMRDGGTSARQAFRVARETRQMKLAMGQRPLPAWSYYLFEIFRIWVKNWLQRHHLGALIRLRRWRVQVLTRLSHLFDRREAK